jgi:hypothetical protein
LRFLGLANEISKVSPRLSVFFLALVSIEKFLDLVLLPFPQETKNDTVKMVIKNGIELFIIQNFGQVI